MRLHVCSFVAALCLSSSVFAQAPSTAAGANTHPVYRELRNLGVGPDAWQVNDLILEKDAAAFALTGTVYMLPPVQGKVTGVVFLGQGTMVYRPPIAVERGMLRALTKGEDFNETFERAVFRFTDDTAGQIKAGASGPGSGSIAQAQDALKDTNDALRLELKENLHARILHDVLGTRPSSRTFRSARSPSSARC